MSLTEEVKNKLIKYMERLEEAKVGLELLSNLIKIDIESLEYAIKNNDFSGSCNVLEFDVWKIMTLASYYKDEG
jgi:hypothetical protein